MIQKILSLLIILSVQLFASQYNSIILELEAKLFPKMILLSEDLDKNATALNIYIIAKEIDTHSAEQFKKLIKSNYPDKILGKKVEVSVKKFKHFKDLPNALIVLRHNEEELSKIALWANKNKIISLAYDPSYMQYGILASIYIGKTTKPYLNKTAIQKYGFVFNPYLLELSKFK
jgi:hypothetical protein